MYVRRLYYIYSDPRGYPAAICSVVARPRLAMQNLTSVPMCVWVAYIYIIKLHCQFKYLNQCVPDLHAAADRKVICLDQNTHTYMHTDSPIYGLQHMHANAHQRTRTHLRGKEIAILVVLRSFESDSLSVLKNSASSADGKTPTSFRSNHAKVNGAI